MLLLGALSFLAFLSLGASANLTFTDCANKELQSIEVPTCTTDPCVLKIGSTLISTVTFVANQDTAKVTHTLVAQVGDLKIEVSDIEHDACKALMPSCPVKKGQNYTLKTTINVSQSLPANSAISFTTNLAGDSGLLTCGKVDAKVEAA